MPEALVVQMPIIRGMCKLGIVTDSVLQTKYGISPSHYSDLAVLQGDASRQPGTALKVPVRRDSAPAVEEPLRTRAVPARRYSADFRGGPELLGQ